MFTSKTVQTILTYGRLVASVFGSASNQTRKVADENVVMRIRFVVGQQQQVDEVFPLSMGRDVEWNGLAFVESYHVHGNVFIQTLKLSDVFDGQWKRQTGSGEFGEMRSIVTHVGRISFMFICAKIEYRKHNSSLRFCMLTTHFFAAMCVSVGM